MDTFRAKYADMSDPAWQLRLLVQLRDHGLVLITGIADRAALLAVARQLMTIRAHRDAAADGVTEITNIGASASGYAAFTDSEPIPHTDGSSVPEPPALLLLTCIKPAREGGATQIADGARIVSTLAEKHPAALRSLSARRSAHFGGAGGYLGAVFEPAGLDRMRIRLRLDDLVRFSADAAAEIPTLRAVVSRHLTTMHLGPGDGLLLCNTRWLHGRDQFAGDRIMLRVLGDSLPGTGIPSGFPAPVTAARRFPRNPDNGSVDSPARRIA
jgi:alpha-ketoglutarate-dependent taurine dioxygenase